MRQTFFCCLSCSMNFLSCRDVCFLVTVYTANLWKLVLWTATDDFTRDLTVLSRNFAVKITTDFRANRRPQNQFNLLQIRCISEQVLKDTIKNMYTITISTLIKERLISLRNGAFYNTKYIFFRRNFSIN